MSGSSVQAFVAAFESVAGKGAVVHGIEGAIGQVLAILQSLDVQCIALAKLPAALNEGIGTYCASRGIRLLQEPYPAAELPLLLDQAQVGITWADFAIAQSGTLAEVATDDALRLVSALPRTHICLVDARTIVAQFMDAGPALRRAIAGGGDGVTVSFISGPSRTGDIEMILTLGVHGPESAYAIVIEEPGA